MLEPIGTAGLVRMILSTFRNMGMCMCARAVSCTSLHKDREVQCHAKSCAKGYCDYLANPKAMKSFAHGQHRFAGAWWADAYNDVLSVVYERLNILFLGVCAKSGRDGAQDSKLGTKALEIIASSSGMGI